ncbi:MAG TPA: autotransporter domain-containing protein [Stellaceae bacterium]|nr:autotransporter domain-containing protein [Stellaceae bacterium]
MAVAAAALLGATLAPAEAQWKSLTDFGDSYADTGFAPGGVLRLPPANFPCPNGPPLAPTCRFTGGTTFVDSLQAIYHLPQATNYAFGGARTDNTNTTSTPGFPEPGFAQELAIFAASGTRFTEHDLIALSIGGNDISLVPSTDTIPQVEALAVAAAGRAAAGVQQLAAAGARTFAWLSTGTTKYFPAPPNGSDGLPLSTDQRDAWANTYYQQTQQMLAPLARSGVRIFLFDFGILEARIAADPGQYGFASAGGCQAILGIPGCLGSSQAVQNSFFFFNAVHPTSAAMAVIATYMANQVDAPETVVPQGSIASSIARNFSTSVLGRLDAYRTFEGAGMSAPVAMAMAYDMPSQALGPPAQESQWSIYGNVEYASGSRDRQFLSAGYDYSAVGGTVGVEYRVDPRLRLGGVFGYSAPDVGLDVQNAHDHIDAYGIAGYASLTDINWFGDALVGFGRQDHALDREGVLGLIRGSTSADTIAVAGHGGYLVNIGPLRAGPIAGIDYTHATIDGYTETGDALLVMTVARQSLDALTGDAGVQLRYPLQLGPIPVSPYLNLTAEHDFLGSGRTVTTTLVTAPLLPVLTPVPDDRHTYGKLAVGIAAAVTERVSATATVATTFARPGGNDLSVSGGIKVSF